MKVLLINPSNKHEIIGNNPSIIEQERGLNPPLGLLYIATYIKENSDHDIEILDMLADNISYEQLSELVLKKNPDIVGITTVTLMLLDVIKVIDAVKSADQKTNIVLGGPHVNLYPDESINLNGVDYLVLGEGEEPFKDLVDNISNKDKLSTLKDDGRFTETRE